MHVKDRKNKINQKCSLKREEKDDSDQTLLNCSLLVFITTSIKVQLSAQTQTNLLFQERDYNLDPNLHLVVPLSVD